MLSDFGDYPPSAPSETFAVRTLASLQTAVSACIARQKCMRVRCLAHSMNGMSVPMPGEALIDVAAVRHIRWVGPASICAGAGLGVWELDEHVRRFGWKLKVTNDGAGQAPSVGGFLSAGGIGTGTFFYGGFWETVRSITIVLADGTTRTVSHDEDLFPWLFGSMGTLGVIYEAVLDLIPSGSSDGHSIPDADSLPATSSPLWPKHVWLTLLVSTDDRETATNSLERLAQTHPLAWEPRESYEYYLPFRCFNPPLLYGEPTDFFAIGIWGDRKGGDGSLVQYLVMEDAFQRYVERTGHRRYFQSELIRNQRALERYVGRVYADAFLDLKGTLDPRGLLNRVPFLRRERS